MSEPLEISAILICTVFGGMKSLLSNCTDIPECCHVAAYPYVYFTLTKASCILQNSGKQAETTVYILCRIIADSKCFSMLCVYTALLKARIASYSKNVSKYYLLLVNAKHSRMSLRKRYFIQSSLTHMLLHVTLCSALP